jgi:hypothetical protein
MERKAAHQKTCGRRKCDTEFRALKRHLALGRYLTPTNVGSPSADTVKIGISESAKGTRPCRIVAGPPLSEEQLRLVTVGAAFGNCPSELDRKLIRKHWLEAEKEIEANGSFDDTVWLEIVSPDGVRCFVASRDDGFYQIGISDDAAGPFETRAFAESVAAHEATRSAWLHRNSRHREEITNG